MITHVVLFKPRTGIGKADLRSFTQLLQVACRRIPTIKRVRVGRVVSLHVGHEQVIGDKTYEAMAYLEFDDMAGLETYMQHPLHAELAELFWKYCESTIFLDAVVADPVAMDVWNVFGPET